MNDLAVRYMLEKDWGIFYNSQDLSQGFFRKNNSQEKSHEPKKFPRSWDKFLSLATLKRKKASRQSIELVKILQRMPFVLLKRLIAAQSSSTAAQ